jgi:glycosyltransferase involved in cell wall biosynthesis
MSHNFQPDIVEYADIDAEGVFHPMRLCPYVVKLHTPHVILRAYYSYKEAPYEQRGIELLEAKSIKRATGISSPSIYLAGEIEKITSIAHERIRYVPNFIDTNAYAPGSNSSEKQSLSVLYVGRLEGLKGAVVFAQAIPIIARAFPQANFIFLGVDRTAKSGQSQRVELEYLFKLENLQDRVKFHGHASSEVFLSFYHQATIFVLPSLFENSPYTLLEAMACGKACVVSRAGGMPEMLMDGESGLFFEPGDPKDLAEKVIGLLQNPERRRSMGLAAREHVKQEYGLDVGTEKTLAFYKSIIEKGKLCASS